MTRFNLAKLCLAAVLSVCPFLTNAQKLPKIQESSVYAPENIKIDGKLSEWKDELQAYNIANYAFYTVSNDENNLYLTMKMKGGLGSRKAFRGGITFRLNPMVKTSGEISVTYPAIYNVNPMIAWDSPVGLLTSTPSEERYRRLYSDTITNKKEIQDLISSSNKTVKDEYKDIHIIGLSGVTDELISVYNQEGVKTAGVFNPLMEYTYELAIPLKYLRAAINERGQVNYTIMLNSGGTVKRKGVTPIPRPVITYPPGKGPSPEMDYFNNTTEFSGQYTLAKK